MNDFPEIVSSENMCFGAYPYFVILEVLLKIPNYLTLEWEKKC